MTKKSEQKYINDDISEFYPYNQPLKKLIDEKNHHRAYFLDTNVLLHDPTCIFRFEEHLVIIPLVVLEEIDAKKSDPIIGFNAREVSQKLELLMEKSHNTTSGILIPNGKDGVLFFVSGLESRNFPNELTLSYVDNIFLSQVMAFTENFPDIKTIIVTKDRNFRIKARALGLQAEDFRHDKITEENLVDIFHPMKEIQLDDEVVNDLFTPSEEGYYWTPYKRSFGMKYNQAAILTDAAGKDFGLGIRLDDIVRYYRYESIKVLDFGPKVLEEDKFNKNYAQGAAIIQGLNDDVTIQAIIGRAGTGKTFLAMAIALEKVFRENKYHSIKMIKPVVSKSRLGEEVGYLPGSLRKKLLPHMRPFLEKLKMFIKEDYLEQDNGLLKLMDEGVIEMLNMADVRGADMTNSIIIFDEAQNANPFQIRTVGTRMGENSKIIVLGDPSQVDNVYLDKYSNALVNLYVNASRFPEPFIATTCLNQMVRSHSAKWFEEKIYAPQERKGKR